MPENDTSTETTTETETPAESEQTTTEETSTEVEGQAPETTAEGTEEETTELSHEDALKELAKVRREAAAQRTKRREIEDRFKDAKTAEEYEAALAEITKERESSERALLVENVALAHEIPEKLHKYLQGSTREELVASAKELAEELGGSTETRTPPRGGLTPGAEDDDDSFNPAAVAARLRRERRGR